VKFLQINVRGKSSSFLTYLQNEGIRYIEQFHDGFTHEYIGHIYAVLRRFYKSM